PMPIATGFPRCLRSGFLYIRDSKFLSQAAKQTKADLLVTVCYPYGGNLRIHGYAIICAVPIPVLSV
ncbi:MAG: hypothetical protein WBP52_05285, partial [Terriglobales bacterium]